GQGIAVLQLLNILEGFDLASMGFGSADYLHCLIEAKKLAFEDRARWCADPQFAQIPLAMLISKDYGEERRALIDPGRAATTLPHGGPELGDTVYLSVGDRDGNMVSLIQSNYMGMGSGMTPGDLGFVLQNRGQLFSLEDGHPNVYAPG
ncbi:MAG: gamma-glutamyltransferase, partial [Pseudomonas stutzeri]|nr:gamma-glutamyltransferase [Stutzerimonas stutzeri]